MRLRPSREGGFGIVTVLMIAFLLAIAAVIVSQKIFNRGSIAQIAKAATYRNAVLNYYYHVAANRHSYECTKLNVPALKNYLDGISPTLNKQAIDIYDVRDPCAVLIPSIGLGFNLGDEYPVAHPSSSPCSSRPFCLSPEVRATGNGDEVEIILTITFDPDKIDSISAKMKERSKSLFFNQTIQKNCSTTLGERAAVHVIFDKITKVNSGISCSGHTLIEPPKDSSNNYVAQCPPTSAGGTTAVVRFNPITGATNCTTDHIVLDPATITKCNSDESDPIIGIEGDATVVCGSDQIPKLIGLPPDACGTFEAIQGFNPSGKTGCTPIASGRQRSRR